MNIEVGKCYFRKRHARGTVRKIVAVEDNKVYYEILHGPSLKRQKHGCQTLRGFKKWATGVTEELPDYSHLDGCIINGTYTVQNTKGEPIFRCGFKRAKFYLRKGYVVEIEPRILQFTNDMTEHRLIELYGNSLCDFFMEVKNDHCVCCGRTTMLTRHHVVPVRLIKRIPQPWRSCLSNILFVCMPCHHQYEQSGEPNIQLGEDPLQYARDWAAHFLETMQPKYVPKGWKIITVKNLDAVKEHGYNTQDKCGVGVDRSLV